jgi:hypothetical protein
VSGFSNPIAGDGGALAYPSIHSPNFESGVQGWSINKDGTAEFSSTVLRGTLTIEGGDEGLFVYSGPPAFGNLLISIAAEAGTDNYGNSYPEGQVFYEGQQPLIEIRPDLGAMLVYQG